MYAVALITNMFNFRGFFGTLTVNLPGPPNDRVWLGFRTNPDLQLVAKPLKFGDTHINISQVTTWIKAKILLEFQVIHTYMHN